MGRSSCLGRPPRGMNLGRPREAEKGPDGRPGGRRPPDRGWIRCAPHGAARDAVTACGGARGVARRGGGVRGAGVTGGGDDGEALAGADSGTRGSFWPYRGGRATAAGTRRGAKPARFGQCVARGDAIRAGSASQATPANPAPRAGQCAVRGDTPTFGATSARIPRFDLDRARARRGSWARFVGARFLFEVVSPLWSGGAQSRVLRQPAAADSPLAQPRNPPARSTRSAPPAHAPGAPLPTPPGPRRRARSPPCRTPAGPPCHAAGSVPAHRRRRARSPARPATPRPLTAVPRPRQLTPRMPPPPRQLTPRMPPRPRTVPTPASAQRALTHHPERPAPSNPKQPAPSPRRPPDSRRLPARAVPVLAVRLQRRAADRQAPRALRRLQRALGGRLGLLVADAEPGDGA